MTRPIVRSTNEEENKQLRKSLSFYRLFLLANAYMGDWATTTGDHKAAMEVLKVIADFLRFAQVHSNDDL
jgi:hypothetical protein